MTELRDLSPEQQSVVESWGRGLAVTAGAGSGKTTTLVVKCAELLRRRPEARFAAVSFTERSASDLRAKLAERLSALEGSHSLRDHWVMTIHGLCGAILREFPREAGFDGEESMLSEPEAQALWARALEALWVDELPDGITADLDLLLDREGRDGLTRLITRTRDLAAFGVLGSLAERDDAASQALARLHELVLERYRRLKARRGALDFSDLENGADRALENERVREHFQRRFDLVLVDEFQDTNPVQARIILRFVKPDLSNLCVVGDPKQSIYRFRDADVSVFEEFCAKLPERRSLTWNFRSRPGIIDFTNALCEPAFAARGMVYEALVPKREPAPEETAVLRLDLTTPAELARWIRAENARGIRLDEMALLLRKIRGNEKWLKALTAAGIPIALGSGGLFWEDPRVRELVAFLKWWDNPGNTLAGAVFLRAPWVNISDETLDAWLKADPTLERGFFGSGHPLASALERFRGAPVRPGELLLSLLVSSEIEAEIGPSLLGLWHRVEELSSRGRGFHDIIAQLTRSVEEGRRERDVPPPRNLGQLSVLTLHGAKGLEFRHVILVDLGPKGRAAESPLLYWDRQEGAFLGGRDEDGERAHKSDPLEQAWRKREQEKNLAESMRVFYVALTRARERLVLACPPVEDVFDPETVFEKDYWRGWLECGGGAGLERGVLPRELPSAPEKSGEELASVPVSRASASEVAWYRPRHSATEWNLLRLCPRAYEWTYPRPRLTAAATSLGARSAAATAGVQEGELTHRELGTRVHACLEKGDTEGLLGLETEAGTRRFQAEPVIRWATESPWMAPSAPDGSRQVWTELAFEVRLAGETLVGSIDRLVFEAGEGGDNPRYTVIDFKITARPKTREELLEAYQAQLEVYAAAIRALQEPGEEAEVRAALVHLSPTGVAELEVPLGQVDLAALAAAARAIVSGENGRPTAGSHCGVCAFRSACSEGRVTKN